MSEYPYMGVKDVLDIFYRENLKYIPKQGVEYDDSFYTQPRSVIDSLSH